MTEEKNNPKTGKQQYESPVLLELGALAKAMGGTTCSVGSNPSGTPCTPGVAAAALCSGGTGVL